MHVWKSLFHVLKLKDFQICLQNFSVENKLYLFPLAIKSDREKLMGGGDSMHSAGQLC